MRFVRFPICPLLTLALAFAGGRADAQQHARSASVAVSLRVLPQASFEGGAEHPVAAALEPGVALRVEPAAGVRTRLTYNTATRVVVSGGPLRGPAGVTVQVRFVCAFGAGTTVWATEPFDCVGGLLAGLEAARTTTIPLSIGAELSARATRDLPPGLYSGRVTLTATHPGY